MRRFVIALLLFLLLVSCGPYPGPIKSPRLLHFVVVVHNLSTSPDRVQVLWAIQGLYVGSEEREIPAGGFTVVVMGYQGPDLVEVRSTALSTSWGPPDWSGGHLQFHIAYPTGATWTE